MNISKARDYFSAYYENTLETGLRAQFERALREDAQVQAEYKAFVRAIEAINALQHEEVEVPFDLHERLSARIDKHVWVQKQGQRTSWLGAWWRSLAVGAVACVAIIGTVMMLTNRGPASGPSIQQAGVLGSASSAGPILSDQQGRLMVRASSADTDKVVITSIDQGKVIATIEVGKEGVNRELKNSNAIAEIIRIDRGKESAVVALPGTQAKAHEVGSGDIHDLAKAIADHFSVSVEIKGASNGRQFNWKLGPRDAQYATAAVIDGATLSTTSGRLILQVSDR